MAGKPNSIALFRKAAKLTQQQLGDLLGVHWVTISKLERGRIKLTLDWADRIGRVLSVDAFNLMREPKEVLAVPDDARTEAAIEAAARAFHENAREKRQFTWEQSSEEWRRDIRNFVRPMVEAALEAADAHDIAIVSQKAKGQG